MREIWETPFGNAILKIERANKHIADFKERLCTSSDRHGPTLHMDGKTGEQFLYYGLHDRELRSDLALITGDAVHNLRSALDIAWVEIFRQIAASRSNHTKFPIDRNKPRQWIVGVLKSAGVDETSRVFDFVVNHVKGYEGGDPDILALHDLDIDDKHRVLIPTVTATGVKGVELEYEDGTTETLGIWLTRPNFYRKVVPFGCKLKNHGEVTFNVTFGTGTPIEHLPIVPMLERFSGKIWELIMWLQRMKRLDRPEI